MIQLVCFYPPLRRFHKQLRVIIFVLEEGIKRQTNFWTFLRNLLIAHIDDFLLKCWSPCVSVSSALGDVFCAPWLVFHVYQNETKLLLFSVVDGQDAGIG